MSSAALDALLSTLFEELQPRWAEAEEQYRTTASSFSALVHVERCETKQTELLHALLSPHGAHGQGTVFLQEFLTLAWPSLLHDQKLLKRAKLFSEHCISVGGRPRRIDLWIEVPGSFILVVESKSMGAPDQAGQIEDYLTYVAERNENVHKKLLYLGRDEQSPRPKSISSESWENHCVRGTADSRQFNEFVRMWLKLCWTQCKAGRVKFYIEDMVSFLDTDDERLSRVTKTLEKPIHQHLNEFPIEQESKDQLEALLSIWEQSDLICQRS